MKYKNLFLLLLINFLFLSFRQKTAENRIKRLPNVLFILIDDLGWQDLTCYGSKFYETPNIDHLRQTGIMFSNAYSACPVCSPSRASILTGKNPAHLQFTGHITRTGNHRFPENGRIVPPKDKMYVDLNEIMISEALKPLGYKSISIGKWHVGDEERYFPTHQGFDFNIGGYEHGSPPTYWAPYKNPSLSWNSVIKNMDEGQPGEYLTDRLTDEAIKFMKENTESPFFMYLSHYAVHTPLEAPDSLVYKYEEKLKSNPIQENTVYAAMIETVDRNVGRLLSELDRLNLSDETIIIFFSDNGGTTEATNNYPLREGKGFLYEGGIRVPLIIKWPGQTEANTICNEPVISDDLFPTIMEMVGKAIEPTMNIDGISLVPMLKGKNHLDREQLCWYYPHYSPQAQMPGYAIRKGDFKLIEHYDPEKIELYNITNDLSEKYDLSEVMPEKVEELKTSFNKWLLKMQPVLHTRNPNYINGQEEVK